VTADLDTTVLILLAAAGCSDVPSIASFCSPMDAGRARCVATWSEAQASPADFCALEPQFGSITLEVCSGIDIAQLGGVDTTFTYYYDGASEHLIGIARHAPPTGTEPVAGSVPSVDQASCMTIAGAACRP